jgi:Sulfatase
VTVWPTQQPARPAVYPVLAALYCVLVLATSNNGELIHWSDLVWPMVSAVAVAGLGSLLGRWLTREPHAAGLVALLTVLSFSWYGYVAGGLYIHFEGDAATRWEPALFGALLAVPLGVALLLRRQRRVGPGLTRWLTTVFGLLVLYNAGLFVADLLGPRSASVKAEPVPRVVPPAGRLPDIYLIVPDKYMGSAALRSHLGFDNSAMVAALKERGFIVPSAPRANYTQTFLALASMLNLRYLDDYPVRFGSHGVAEQAFPEIEQNQTVRLLRAHGYRFVFLPTAFGATRQNREADLQLPDPSEIQPEFVTAWRRTTMLPFLHRVSCAVLGCTLNPVDYVPETAALIDWKFRQLERVASPDRPTFVLAHLMVPHEPYMYGPDCEHLRPYWPATENAEHWPQIRFAYLNQIRCVNQKLLRLVDAIRVNASVPPVILIQSDHGHGRLGRQWPLLDETEPSQIAERFSVFAAYAIPNLTAIVPDTITPVNALRLALGTALGADLPALPDRSYWSTVEHPYDFTPLD